MPNGKRGDHPLTDILLHGMQVYGEEADEAIRKIAALSSTRELDAWWESTIGWKPDKNTVLPAAQKYLKELEQRAKEGGWEPR